MPLSALRSFVHDAAYCDVVCYSVEEYGLALPTPEFGLTPVAHMFRAIGRNSDYLPRFAY